MLGADDAALIEHIHSRPHLHIPPCCDRAANLAAIPKGPPSNPLLLKDLLEFLPIGIAVDAQENEWLAFQILHERPLVGIHAPARASPVPPEVENHHLPTVIAKSQLLRVDVLAL